MLKIEQEELDMLITRMLHILDACEAKAVTPSIAYRKGINNLIQKERLYLKHLANKYPRKVKGK